MNEINALTSSLPEYPKVTPPVPAEAAQAVEAPRESSYKLSVDLAAANTNSALKGIKNEERQFLVDEDLGRLVVKIVNSDTKELIRQMPTEEALMLSKRLLDIVELMSV